MTVREGQSTAPLPPAEGLRKALLTALTVTLLGVIPVVVTVIGIRVYAQGDSVAFDFHRELYPEADLVLHGHNPYPPVDADLSHGTNNIWPVAAVLPVIPLTFLSIGTADWVMTAIMLASLPLPPNGLTPVSRR